jgi:hypothetical protein
LITTLVRASKDTDLGVFSLHMTLKVPRISDRSLEGTFSLDAKTRFDVKILKVNFQCREEFKRCFGITAALYTSS